MEADFPGFFLTVGAGGGGSAEGETGDGASGAGGSPAPAGWPPAVRAAPRCGRRVCLYSCSSPGRNLR